MEQTMKEGMSKIALMMLMASGADIVAPKELKRQTIETLELENNSNFIGVDDDLKQVKNQDEKLTIIKGIILTHLTPSQMISLYDVISTGITANLEYLKDYPEKRGEAPDIETIMKRLLELG
jgi:predicted nuclease of restriction endonuclease-like (RecB) superfamily